VRLWSLSPVLVVLMLLFVGCGREEPRKAVSSPVATSSESTAQAADIEAITATFEQYRSHLLARNGAAVWDVVSPGTVDYYNELARLVATAGPEELAGKSLVDRFTVARFRVDLPADQLAAMDGRAVLAHGVDQGYIDQSSVANSELGDIRIDDDRAFAPLVTGSQRSPVDFEFVRVGQDWKFDLAATMPHANAEFSKMARESGQTEDEFIFEMLEILSGERVDASIYNRP
jgi:hypothetical protein